MARLGADAAGAVRRGARVAGVDPRVHGPRARSPATRKALDARRARRRRPRPRRAQRGVRGAGARRAARARASTREQRERQRRRHRARPPARRVGRAARDHAGARAARAAAARYGLATMCIGVGQGIATIIENVRQLMRRRTARSSGRAGPSPRAPGRCGTFRESEATRESGGARSWRGPCWIRAPRYRPRAFTR